MKQNMALCKCSSTGHYWMEMLKVWIAVLQSLWVLSEMLLRDKAMLNTVMALNSGAGTCCMMKYLCGNMLCYCSLSCYLYVFPDELLFPHLFSVLTCSLWHCYPQTWWFRKDFCFLVVLKLLALARDRLPPSAFHGLKLKNDCPVLSSSWYWYHGYSVSWSVMGEH